MNKKITLTPEQQKIISYRGGHLQVIACAGSGKTESVSRRVAALISEGATPESIIAFTFTEKAAAELKERIYARVADIKGSEFLGRLAPMFVGTIHSYCFHLLQNHVPRYGNYDVLDEHRHIGLLSREYDTLCLGRLGHRHWQPVRDFAFTVDVLGNELIDAKALKGSAIEECFREYEVMLDRYRYLTFGGIIARAVEALEDPSLFKPIHRPIRHLIVDEYQDINPAQERLIELMSQKPVHLCVVGDDDQSIYQWRGSDIENILTFEKRKKAKSERLEENRRSRPGIVNAANSFAATIPGRLDKTMKPVRKAAVHQVIPWMAKNPDDEARKIADAVLALHEKGNRFQDMTLLFRSVRTSAGPFIEEFDRRGIPYSCGGRTGLFMQPEINRFGEIMAWFVDGDWKEEQYGPKRKADINAVLEDFNRRFAPRGKEVPGLRKYLEDWKNFRLRGNRPVSLVGDFYRLLNKLGVHRIDIDSGEGAARMGAYARFSEFLGDFEHVTRRGRFIKENGKRDFRGGLDRGKLYYQKLLNYLLHYAFDAYEDFPGEERYDIDMVDIITVHQAKGLEWPIVFVPGLTSLRFPSKNAGKEKDWLLPEDVFPEAVRRRYEGGDTEERRLFYVAMTRARDVLYLSSFERITNIAKPSPYLSELAERHGGLKTHASLPLPSVPGTSLKPGLSSIDVEFSALASFEECGYRYRLGARLGFQSEIATELGYGRAIHHILRRIADSARSNGRVPSAKQIERIMESDFYLPFASKPELERMHSSAWGIVNLYMSEYRKDLSRVWETERPFQLLVDGGTIKGRADVILDYENGRPGKLAIVDYKTANDPRREETYALQMAVYASAARAEGLEVEAGYIHELKQGKRKDVDISPKTRENAVSRVTESMGKIRRGEFRPCPEKDKCTDCDYRLVCRYSVAKE